MDERESGIVDPEGNRLYESASDLGAYHWERLAARDAEECARASGCVFEEGVFRLDFMGRAMGVDRASRKIFYWDERERDVGFQRALVIVSYLAGALDAPPSGRFVPPRELPGGEAFFRGPHALAEPLVAERFKDAPQRLLDACAAFGGRVAKGGDASVVLPVLPKIDLQLILWGADEEFAAKCVLLVDSRAHLHLALDCVWALTNVVCRSLAGWQ